MSDAAQQEQVQNYCNSQDPNYGHRVYVSGEKCVLTHMIVLHSSQGRQTQLPDSSRAVLTIVPMPAESYNWCVVPDSGTMLVTLLC